MSELSDRVRSLIASHRADEAFTRQLEGMLQERDETATSFWIRDTDDLVNAVVLDDVSIYDVSWQPARNMSQNIVLPLDQIVSIETRETPEAAVSLGFAVTGDMAVLVHTASTSGGLVWAAGGPDSAVELADFTTKVVQAMNRRRKP